METVTWIQELHVGIQMVMFIMLARKDLFNGQYHIDSIAVIQHGNSKMDMRTLC